MDTLAICSPCQAYRAETDFQHSPSVERPYAPLRPCIQLLWCSYPTDGVAPLELYSFLNVLLWSLIKPVNLRLIRSFWRRGKSGRVPCGRCWYEVSLLLFPSLYSSVVALVSFPCNMRCRCPCFLPLICRIPCEEGSGALPLIPVIPIVPSQ